MLAIGAVVAWNLVEVRRFQEAELLALAHSASKTVDLRITRVATITSALATSGAVIDRDWDETRARVKRLGPGALLWTTVTDAAGRTLLSTAAVPVAAPPPANVQAALRTAEPVVSNLFVGLAGGPHVVAVSQAVVGVAEPMAVTAVTDPGALLPTTGELAAPAIAMITVVDRDYRVLARTRNQDRWQGRMATPRMIAMMRRDSEGVVTSRSLDGEPTVVAYTRSPLTGWTTMMVAPRSTVFKPVLANGVAFLLLAAVLLGLGLVLSRTFARTLIRDLHRLEDDALTLGRGEIVAPRPGPIENIDRVQATLSAASSELQRRASRQHLMLNELNHRVKNTLATVQSLAGQTFRSQTAQGMAQDAPEAFDKRLAALASAHDLLTQTSWEPVDIRSVVERCAQTAAETVRWSGPSAVLPAQTALALCMCLHELLTNAMKYGALSVPAGIVRLTWTRGETGEIEMVWREEGGPLATPPERQGFGSRLIDRLTRTEMGGEIARDYGPDGLTVTLRIAPTAAGPWNNDFG